MRIPGYGRVAKAISKKIAQYNKNSFTRNIEETLSKLSFDKEKNLDLEIISFSGYGGFWDQVLSIISFVKNVGIPRRWIIYSDKCNSEEQKNIYSKFPFVVHTDWDVNYKGEFGANKDNFQWQLKKFVSFSKHHYNGTTIFTDSDILFYPLFKNYLNIINKGNWFLPEPPDAQDSKKSASEKGSMYSFNAGFFILDGNIDFTPAIQYMSSDAAKSEYFADQEALNIIIQNLDQINILDPRIFYLTVNDHFTISHAISYEKIAMRHFVGPVRQKMWQRDWAKTLNL